MGVREEKGRNTRDVVYVGGNPSREAKCTGGVVGKCAGGGWAGDMCVVARTDEHV